MNIGVLDVRLKPTEVTELQLEQQAQLNQLPSIFPISLMRSERQQTGQSIATIRLPYRISLAKRAALKQTVTKMLANRVIEESESSWTTQAVLVPKKDDGVRCCTNYRKLSQATVPDLYL